VWLPRALLSDKQPRQRHTAYGNVAATLPRMRTRVRTGWARQFTVTEFFTVTEL